ncbi:MAG: GGDEF domain-containing protein [Bdellovibrionota bacterium]
MELESVMNAGNLELGLKSRIGSLVAEVLASRSFTELVERFSKILSEHFKCDEFYLCKIITKGGLTRIVSSRKLGHITTIGSDLCRELEKTLAVLDDSQESGQKGLINSIQFVDGNYNFIELGEHESARMVGVWKQSEFLTSTEFAILLSLFNRECFWYAKLEDTQTRLFQDELTELYNYRYLGSKLDAEIKRAERFHETFSLIFIDLDDFKKINDVYGHLSGNSILKQVGGLLTQLLREVDGIFRYGGDEFIILLLGADANAAQQVGERIRAALAMHSFKIDKCMPINLTVSVGIACYPMHGRQKEELIRAADKSMYSSKMKGKNKVILAQREDAAPFNSNIEISY